MGMAIHLDNKRQFPLQVKMSLTYMLMGMAILNYLRRIILRSEPS